MVKSQGNPSTLLFANYRKTFASPPCVGDGIRWNNHVRQAPSWLEPSGLTRKSWTHLWSWLSARTRLLPMSRGRKSMRLHLICNVSRSIAWATQAPPEGWRPPLTAAEMEAARRSRLRFRERGCACVALFAWVCPRATAPPRRRPLKDAWNPGRPGNSGDGWVAGCISVVDNLLADGIVAPRRVLSPCWSWSSACWPIRSKKDACCCACGTLIQLFSWWWALGFFQGAFWSECV